MFLNIVLNFRFTKLPSFIQNSSTSSKLFSQEVQKAESSLIDPVFMQEESGYACGLVNSNWK
jgi:hypothetical protein